MPSSLGLSVLVPATVGQVAVQVAWGHYERETLLGEELEALLEARRAANVAKGNVVESEPRVVSLPRKAQPDIASVENGTSAGDGAAKARPTRAIWVRKPHAPHAMLLTMGSLPERMAVPGSNGLVLYLVSRRARSCSNATRRRAGT